MQDTSSTGYLWAPSLLCKGVCKTHWDIWTQCLFNLESDPAAKSAFDTQMMLMVRHMIGVCGFVCAHTFFFFLTRLNLVWFPFPCTSRIPFRLVLVFFPLPVRFCEMREMKYPTNRVIEDVLVCKQELPNGPDNALFPFHLLECDSPGRLDYPGDGTSAVIVIFHLQHKITRACSMYSNIIM